MCDRTFEFEGIYSVVTRKDFWDELENYYTRRCTAVAFVTLAEFALTKGVECRELEAGTVVLYPRRSPRKRPACAIASTRLLTLYPKIWTVDGYMYLYFMEAGSYDLARAS